MKKKTIISKRQDKFLKEFLRTKSLENLLPLYVAAISNDTELFKILPENLIAPIVESLRNIQSTIGLPKEPKESGFSLDEILRNLRNLNTNELLSRYTFSLTGNPASFSEISEDILTSAESWLDELRACVTGKNGLFSNEFDPETYVDGFIQFAGGERIIKTSGANDPTNADYFFQNDNVIIELKILKTDFLESNKDKLELARKEALKKIKITPEMILGTVKSYPKELFDAEFRVIRDALQRRTKDANKQIKKSKTLLNAANAKGVVIFLIDGFYSISPFLTIELLYEPLSRQFSAVDSMIFLNFRRKVTLNLDDGPYDYFIYQPRFKETPSNQFADFIDRLGKKWFEYMQLLSGKRFDKHILSYDSRNLSGGIWK